MICHSNPSLLFYIYVSFFWLVIQICSQYYIKFTMFYSTRKQIAATTYIFLKLPTTFVLCWKICSIVTQCEAAERQNSYQSIYSVPHWWSNTTLIIIALKNTYWTSSMNNIIICPARYGRGYNKSFIFFLNKLY